jgi:hypothetical protein
VRRVRYPLKRLTAMESSTEDSEHVARPHATGTGECRSREPQIAAPLKGLLVQWQVRAVGGVHGVTVIHVATH